MIDPATCRKYAEECRRLAATAPENDRRLLPASENLQGTKPREGDVSSDRGSATGPYRASDLVH
jgi:hypothetical protein